MTEPSPAARRAANWRVTLPLLSCLVAILLLAFLVFRYFLLTFVVAGSLALPWRRAALGPSAANESLGAVRGFATAAAYFCLSTAKVSRQTGEARDADARCAGSDRTPYAMLGPCGAKGSWR